MNVKNATMAIMTAVAAGISSRSRRRLARMAMAEKTVMSQAQRSNDPAWDPHRALILNLVPSVVLLYSATFRSSKRSVSSANHMRPMAPVVNAAAA
ncbi:MAG: hypothetical protein KDC36_11005 [Thermoleophilia bacterium]|nr:hypothetical protein [Thermoleophilia bacterium]